jgi:diguanylate cyclase (GGDEF)-like protein
VHPDDRDAFVKAMDRKTLVAALDRDKTFVLTYRYLSEKGPVYVSMRISRMEDDERFIIIGVTDVDEQMKQRRAAQRVQEEQLAYTRLKALNGNYIWVYVVEPETGSYRELSETEKSSSPTMDREGEDFFAAAREASRKYTCAEDQNRFLTSFTKENVMEEIARKGVYTLHYRFMLDGVPTYVILKAATVEEKEGSRLVVGLINVDDQTRLAEKNEMRMMQAHAKASIDALTGIKNKHAYLEAEERMNVQIAERRAPEFAIVLLDVNDLKKINDTEGHNAGDQYIKDACKIICDTFKHSPVFRIGGDEFAVISRGDDYARMDELIERMNRHNEEAIKDGGVVIACGMAKYQGEDSVAPVFERADQSMYENKSALKAKRA